MVGRPIQRHSAEIIQRFGGYADNFAARQLTPGILQETDLVLTMATEHRGEVLRQDASLLKRTFTVREFARMLEVLGSNDPVSSGAGPMSNAGIAAFWRELPAKAAEVRYLSLPSVAGQDDVVDPYRRGPDAYRQMEDELAPALLAILRFARISAGG
ncbi:protein-tyrosine phosphatase [Arthrobacter bambusae]|uniref:Protein-tyrosine phosphatase n=2 Tax=Arthrobacter bambusae TaxID=1338426 RepID=A0AAW8DDJ5_9MICC|nr:protein-tyrosine phosphatase [Arthrobacter bambusae]MDQ0129388.1 protein-tyrosine phosphatase [Arthrobacter bambusae]MDQ0180999.1 protein-tyrosine phosphatase [Arthrobacter bambusae]